MHMPVNVPENAAARRRRLALSRTVSATYAVRNLSELMTEVRESGSAWIVERGGSPIGQIGPPPAAAFRARDLADLLRSLPKAGDEFADAVEESRSRGNRPSVPKNPWGR